MIGAFKIKNRIQNAIIDENIKDRNKHSKRNQYR